MPKQFFYFAGLLWLFATSTGIAHAQQPRVTVQSPLAPAATLEPVPASTQEPVREPLRPPEVASDDDSARPPAGQWRILVVNDDGFEAQGLQVLVGELNAVGEVVVSVPDGNRSGASHSFTAFSQIQTIRRIEVPGAVEAVATSGTPADAVDFGLTVLGADRPFDLVVSGINRGANVGEIAHLSGTVGAAMQGALRGVPSIAVSLDSQATDAAGTARFTADFVRDYLERGAAPGVVLSINVPKASADQPQGTVIAPMAGLYAQIESYSKISTTADGTEQWQANVVLNDEAPADSDTLGYLAGLITITPLAFDWTDREALDQLKGWAQDWGHRAAVGDEKQVPAEPLPPG